MPGILTIISLKDDSLVLAVASCGGPKGVSDDVKYTNVIQALSQAGLKSGNGDFVVTSDASNIFTRTVNTTNTGMVVDPRLITISGKGAVLKAMWLIPVDSIYFNDTYRVASAEHNKIFYELARTRYTLAIKEQESTADILPFLKNVYKDLAMGMINEAFSLEKKYQQSSSVMQVLHNELICIAARYYKNEAEDIFNLPQYKLVQAAIWNALQQEKAKPTITKTGLSSIFSKASLLAPDYDELLQKMSLLIGLPVSSELQSTYQTSVKEQALAFNKDADDEKKAELS